MKRTFALTMSLLLIVAQVFVVLRPAQGLRSARVNACCLKHTTLPGVGLGTEADGVAGGTAALKAPACCQRDCCAQAPSSTNRIPLAAQASPDLSRLLPGVVILTLSWTLPSAPVRIVPASSAFADTSQEPGVPLFTRHCLLLI